MRSAAIFFGLVTLSLTANAQTPNSGNGRIDVTGTAPSACVITGAPTAIGSNARISQSGLRSSEVVINQLVDLNTGAPRAASISVAIPIICNSAHRLIVTTASGALTRVADGAVVPASTGFRESVPYGLRADWAGRSIVRNSGNAPLEVVNADGAAGELGLSVEVAGGGTPLVAGDYVEFITVELKAEY